MRTLCFVVSHLPRPDLTYLFIYLTLSRNVKNKKNLQESAKSKEHAVELTHLWDKHQQHLVWGSPWRRGVYSRRWRWWALKQRSVEWLWTTTPSVSWSDPRAPSPQQWMAGLKHLRENKDLFTNKWSSLVWKHWIYAKYNTVQRNVWD